MKNLPQLLSLSECPLWNLRTDDIFLMRFLNACDWNVIEAYARITKLFKLKVSSAQLHNWLFAESFSVSD